MATNNLEVKFKVETSDLRKGSSDAKRTVKDTADQMARDVKGAAQDMTSSMGKITSSVDKVSDATKSIADAANVASNGVRNLEQNVAQSASSMERNLSKVSRQMSAMQAFHMGTRAVGMAAGVAKNVAILTGNKDAVESIDATASVLTGGLQGAAMGFAVTGGNPIGTAVGGLIGAGAALLDVAAKQKEAAEKQMEAAKASIEQSKLAIELIDQDYRSRERVKMIQDLVSRERGYGRNTAGKLDLDFAQGEIDLAKANLLEAEKRQQRIQDMIYGRNDIPTQIEDWNKVLGDIKKIEVDGVEYDISGFDLPKTTGVIDWMAPGAAEAIARLFAEAFRTEDSKNWEAEAMAYAEAGLPPPVHPAQLKAGDFDEKVTAEIASKVLDSLRKMAIEADIAVTEAQRVLSEFAPLQARIDKERAIDAARMNAPLQIDEDDWPEYYGADVTQEPLAWTESLDKKALAANKKTLAANKEALKAGMQQLRDFTSLLNGIVGGAGFSSPTDALTRIGGGRGYASYNDSAARVQMRIEASLRTLIKNQTDQNNEILHAIENISIGDPDIAWQQEQ